MRPVRAPAAARRRRNADLKAIGITAALAVLPTLLKGKGGLGVILGPVVALAAYAIYRENVKPARTIRMPTRSNAGHVPDRMILRKTGCNFLLR